MTAQLACVPPNQAFKFWPKAAGYVREAMRRGDLGSYDVVRSEVLGGRALLWLVIEEGGDVVAAVVTQLTETEWRKVCEIIACGGRQMPGWLPLIEQIEEYARREGCEATRIMGREGWMRVLPKYRPHRVVLERML